MICPCCLQGDILKVRIIKTAELMKICDECDMVWKESETVSDTNGTVLSEKKVSWRDFDIMGKIS